MTKDQFIEQVFEIAFGHDAINRDFEYSEVIEQLEELMNTLFYGRVSATKTKNTTKENFTKDQQRRNYPHDNRHQAITQLLRSST